MSSTLALFQFLSATANADSMSIEEYMADVLAKRVSAETEENSEVSSHTLALQKALSASASTVSPTINQGVEIKDAQHAIRRLMSDVVWHRTPWYQPQSALPARAKSPADADESGTANAAEVRTATDDMQRCPVFHGARSLPNSPSLVISRIYEEIPR
jgi:hypothetical protein